VVHIAVEARHPDHQGRDFDLSQAAFDYFDHTLANFDLRWHQINYDTTPLDCGACHYTATGFTQNPNVCADCHTNHDPNLMNAHSQAYGADCLTCHDGIDRMTSFDHQQTRFPLVGNHRETQCGDCHQNGGFSGLPTDCIFCHAEPALHQGLFSTGCAACHTPESWSQISGVGMASFDHYQITGFGLTRHRTDYANAAIQCAGCHTPGDGIKVAFDLNLCLDCHTQADLIFMGEHQTQFGVDCLTCHDGLDRMHDFEHNRVFFLDGRHVEIECVDCHINQIFTGTPAECGACHTEPELHAGYFGVQCENCHSSQAWTPARMTAHNFPLDHGEQGLIACETCHTDRYTAYTCYGCHEHQPGEILSKHREEGISQAELVGCVACHPTGLEND